MFYTERTSPGPGWAALDEPVQTPPSINDDEEDELEDELESQSGYRSSTPLKRKNSKHVIKQGTTKRSRRESPSSFNESSLSGSRDGGTSNVGASNNGLLRHRSESLSMDDLLTSRIIPSTQPITKTSTTAKSTNFAGKNAGKKRNSFPADGNLTSSALSNATSKLKSISSVSSAGSKSSSLSAFRGGKVTSGDNSEDDILSSATLKASSQLKTGVTSQASHSSISLKKKKSLVRMDVDEQGSHFASSIGNRNGGLFLRRVKQKVAGGSKPPSRSTRDSLSQPSASAPVKSRGHNAESSTRDRIRPGPPSAIKIPENKGHKGGPAKPRSSLPMEIINITDDDEPPPITVSQSKGPVKGKKSNEAVSRPGQEVLEILDSDEERERGREIARLAARGLLSASLTSRGDASTRNGQNGGSSSIRVKKEPISDVRKRRSLPNISLSKSRETEVVIISDSEDENMRAPPTVTAVSRTSLPSNSLVLSSVAGPSITPSTNLQSSLTSLSDGGSRNHEKEVELSQGVDALSLVEGDHMSLDGEECEVIEHESLPPPETPSPPPGTMSEHPVPMRACSSPNHLLTFKTSIDGLHLDTEASTVPSTIPITDYSSEPTVNEFGTHVMSQPSADHSPSDLSGHPKPNRASLTEAEEPLLSTSTHLQSDPLFLSSSSPSSSSPPLSEPPPRMQLARKSTGGGRNMVRKRTMHSSRRALRSFEAHSEDSEAATGSENNRNQRDLPVSSSEITIPSFVSVEPKGNLSESYDLLPSTSEVTPSTTDDLPTIPTRKDKGKARLNLNSHGAGRQSIADAINLAGASNAQSHGRRKSRVESRAGATTAAAPSTPGLSREYAIDLTAALNATTLNTSSASTTSTPDMGGIPASRTLQGLIDKKGDDNEVNIANTSRASTDELSLRPSVGIARDEGMLTIASENRNNRSVTSDGLVSTVKDNIRPDSPSLDSDHISVPTDDTEDSAEDAAECQAFLEYSDDQPMEDDSMAENSRSDNSYSFNDGNLSDDPLARPLSPSSGELNYVPDDEYHLDDEPQPTSPTPPSDNDDTTGEPKTYGGLPALVWKQYRKDPANFGRKVHWGRDIPHSLEDQINGMSKLNRMHPQMRNIMLAAIRQNTVEDEQDAPDIIIENEVDDEPTPPWEFHYSNQLWHADDVPPPDMKSLVSCDCIGKCDPKSKTCACVRRQGAFFHEGDPADFVYDSRGRLKKPGFPIFECNDACSCNDDCRNRVVQNGRTVSVKIAKTPNKGWGVFAGPRKIPKGTFLGVYSGELITDAAGEQRGKVYNTFGRTYLFDLDFHHLRKDDPDWDVKYTVDAYHAGNFTRFLNHSCDPNARLFACYINDGNLDKPMLSVFTIHDIEPDEEICFSYSGNYPDDGYSSDEDEEGEEQSKVVDQAIYRSCLCGSKYCTGKMFN